MPLDVGALFADTIVRACCMLHNVVRKKDGVWAKDEYYECSLEDITQVGLRGDSNGLNVRDYFADYFISSQRSVPWQYDNI